MVKFGIPIVVSFLMILAPFHASAQESKVISGVLAFQEQNFQKALSDLDQALVYPEELARGNHVKALYYRGLTRIYMYNNAVLKNDQDMISAYPDAYMEAYDDLVAARGEDDGTWEARIKTELDDLHPSLVQTALLNLNNALDQLNNGDARFLFQRADKYAEAASSIKETYLVNDIRGQAQMNLGNYEEAARLFRGSINLYEADPPEEPDFLQTYVYYRLADMYLSFYKNGQQAMDVVKSGLVFIEKEKLRFEGLPGDMSEEEKESKQNQYENGKADLKKFELELYLKVPELKGEGLLVFKEAVEDDPLNYDLRVAYATLLESVDFESAIEQYKIASEIDPDNDLPWFNSGVIYYNRAREFYQKASVASNEEKYGFFMTEAEKYFKEAWPYFERSLELNPANLNSVTALKTLSQLLNKTDEYEKYSALEKEMTGY
jgi:hypothetical protein